MGFTSGLTRELDMGFNNQLTKGLLTKALIKRLTKGLILGLNIRGLTKVTY